MSEKIQITVDGRTAEAEEGATVLAVLRELGVEVPALCHHPAIEPSGACRLCVVEITHPDWRGWSGLVTSCLYPVEPGLQVSTRSERVMRTRRTLLELYLAQCPDSEAVRKVARTWGVDSTPFPLREDGDLCIVCGLCTRVCQDLGPAAIAPLSRGTEKIMGPRPDRFGEDCTACGACALVCPTGEIRMERKDGRLHIWNRAFQIPLCSVTAEHCRGCGLCEEVCPLAIPRVTAYRTGSATSKIEASACTGCGICAGACPTGAITQERCAAEHPAPADRESLKGRIVVFACSRSPFPEAAEDPGAAEDAKAAEGAKAVKASGGAGSIGAAENMVAVPCVGRVTVENMLECLARGADGVLLLCRDKETCPSERGGGLGASRVKAAEALAASAGLGPGRIACARPPRGLEGPAEALAAFRAALKPSPLRETYGGSMRKSAGMDHALEILAWLRARPELEPALPACLADLFAGPAGGEDIPFYVGGLADLDGLLSLIVPDWRLRELFEDAARLLEEKGIRARPVTAIRQVKEGRAGKVLAFCPCALSGIDGGVEVVTLDALAGAPPMEREGRPGSPPAGGAGRRGAPLAEGAGPSPGEPCGFSFRITRDQRREGIERLKAGSGPIRCACPFELAQYRLLQRQGAWQEGIYGEPFMAFSDAVRTRTGEAEA